MNDQRQFVHEFVLDDGRCLSVFGLDRGGGSRHFDRSET